MAYHHEKIVVPPPEKILATGLLRLSCFQRLPFVLALYSHDSQLYLTLILIDWTCLRKFPCIYNNSTS